MWRNQARKLETGKEVSPRKEMTPDKAGSFAEARWRTTPPSWPKDRGRETEASDKGSGETVRSPSDNQGRTPVQVKVQRIEQGRKGP